MRSILKIIHSDNVTNAWERLLVSEWVNELRQVLSSCEYVERTETMDRIVFGVADMRVKERLLRETYLTTLGKALGMCHTAEGSKVQMKVMVTEHQ